MDLKELSYRTIFLIFNIILRDVIFVIHIEFNFLVTDFT